MKISEKLYEYAKQESNGYIGLQIFNFIYYVNDDAINDDDDGFYIDEYNPETGISSLIYDSETFEVAVMIGNEYAKFGGLLGEAGILLNLCVKSNDSEKINRVLNKNKNIESVIANVGLMQSLEQQGLQLDYIYALNDRNQNNGFICFTSRSREKSMLMIREEAKSHFQLLDQPNWGKNKNVKSVWTKPESKKLNISKFTLNFLNRAN